MSAWFGPAYGAPYESDLPHEETPTGATCLRCRELIEDGDSGLLFPHVEDGRAQQRAVHYECHLRGIVGGLNHLRGRCTCCGGSEPPDPPGMSAREAARLAVDYWQHERRETAWK